jgi:hypothetical protein
MRREWSALERWVLRPRRASTLRWQYLLPNLCCCEGLSHRCSLPDVLPLPVALAPDTAMQGEGLNGMPAQERRLPVMQFGTCMQVRP